MNASLGDKARVQHILKAISEIESYLDGVSKEIFLANSEKRFATVKQIEIIGEACNRISPELKQLHPEIAWAEINGFRNISIHEYFGVNFTIVWEIAKNDLSVLQEQFRPILTEIMNNPPN
jgi:uncharacterized protein with HEPN domain